MALFILLSAYCRINISFKALDKSYIDNEIWNRNHSISKVLGKLKWYSLTTNKSRSINHYLNLKVFKNDFIWEQDHSLVNENYNQCLLLLTLTD